MTMLCFSGLRGCPSTRRHFNAVRLGSLSASYMSPTIPMIRLRCASPPRAVKPSAMCRGQPRSVKLFINEVAVCQECSPASAIAARACWARRSASQSAMTTRRSPRSIPTDSRQSGRGAASAIGLEAQPTSSGSWEHEHDRGGPLELDVDNVFCIERSEGEEAGSRAVG